MWGAISCAVEWGHVGASWDWVWQWWSCSFTHLKNAQVYRLTTAVAKFFSINLSKTFPSWNIWHCAGSSSLSQHGTSELMKHLSWCFEGKWVSKLGSGLGGEKIVCKEFKYLGFLEVCWALRGSLLCFADSTSPSEMLPGWETAEQPWVMAWC